MGCVSGWMVIRVQCVVQCARGVYDGDGEAWCCIFHR